MPIVNMLEAKTQLSRLVESVESGAEREIVIARNGKPAARLVPIEQPTSRKLGMWADRGYPGQSQEEFDADNDIIAEMFNGKQGDPPRCTALHGQGGDRRLSRSRFLHARRQRGPRRRRGRLAFGALRSVRSSSRRSGARLGTHDKTVARYSDSILYFG